jgi:hypothetical protein
MGYVSQDRNEAVTPVSGGFVLAVPAYTSPARDMLDRLVAAAERETDPAVGVWEALCPSRPPRLWFDPVDGRGLRHAGGPRLVRPLPRNAARTRLIADAHFEADRLYEPVVSSLRLASVGPGMRGGLARLRAALASVAPVDAVLANVYSIPRPAPSVACPALAAIMRASPGREPGLRRALASLARQTWPVAEIAIVADGDIDIDAAMRGSGIDPARVQVTPGPRRGPAAAGNAGLAVVRAPLAFFLDDDDAVWPWHAQTMLGTFDSYPECAWVAALALEVSSGAAGGTGYALRGRLHDIEALRARNPFAIQSVVFRVDDARAAGGFDPALEALEDWDLWLRLAARAPLATSAEVTSEFGVPGARATRRARAAVHARHFAEVAARAGKLSLKALG